MKFRLTHKKPTFSTELPSLCNFRSSKAYLWGLIRERLQFQQDHTPHPLFILDAACHALITRNMFPRGCKYHGLDISTSRLKTAFNSKNTHDILYQADLCRPLCLDNTFDVVVSLNTLSHLPNHQQGQALQNLINSCFAGGSLFVNCNTNSSLQLFTRLLSSHFNSLEIVYFDSYLSFSDEESSLINKDNIAQKTVANEFNVPNDACFHSQVLYIAHGNNSNSPRSRPPGTPSKTLQLNQVPDVRCFNFPSDSDIVSSKFCTSDTIFLMTSKLFTSTTGRLLRSKLASLVSSVLLLDDFTSHKSAIYSSICILGLEKEWVSDLAHERIIINYIREIPDVTLNFLLVSTRDNLTCTPSLIATDV